MRIVWLSHFVPWPPRSGALLRSHNLLVRAAAQHDVELVTLHQGALLAQEELPAAVRALEPSCRSVQVFAIPSDRSRLHWLAMVARGLMTRTSYDVSWLHSSAMTRHVQGLAQRGGVDLVHVDTVGLMPYAELFRGVPRVLTHHNIESHMMERRAVLEPSSLRRRYLALEARRLADLERRACTAVAHNVVVSSLDGERLRAVVGDVATAVIPNGVDLDYFRPAGTPDARSLVFVGGMDNYANRGAVRLLVREIWPLLSAEPGWKLSVIGRDPSPELLEAARDARVSAPGLVDDIRPFVAAAGIYVCPIHDGGGTRLKVLDALAMGKALVATRLAVEGIAVEEGVHYLGAENAAEFAAQIRRLAADGELRASLGRAARAAVEKHYGWEHIGSRLLDVYEQAVRRLNP